MRLSAIADPAKHAQACQAEGEQRKGRGLRNRRSCSQDTNIISPGVEALVFQLSRLPLKLTKSSASKPVAGS